MVEEGVVAGVVVDVVVLEWTIKLFATLFLFEIISY